MTRLSSLLSSSRSIRGSLQGGEGSLQMMHTAQLPPRAERDHWQVQPTGLFSHVKASHTEQLQAGKDASFVGNSLTSSFCTIYRQHTQPSHKMEFYSLINLFPPPSDRLDGMCHWLGTESTHCVQSK